jgi:DNA-binding transcriptional MerR regulator
MALSQISFEFEDNSQKKDEARLIAPQTTGSPKLKRGRKSLKEMGIDADLVQIPEDEILFQKQYYSIGDVATMFKENTSLIRYWENEFSILKPKKNRKGDRFFRPEDVKNLKLIYHLLRERKYTIDGAKDFLKNNKSAAEKHEMLESLQKIKSFLLELKSNL